MRRVLYISIAAVLLFVTGQTNAQQFNAGTVEVSRVSVEWKPLLDIRMQLDLGQVYVKSKEAVEIIPLLVGKKDTLELSRVLVVGKTREILYRRSGKMGHKDYIQVVRRKNGAKQSVDYVTGVPAEKWMDGARLVLMTDLCGCGWRSLEPAQQRDVTRIEAPKKPEFKPVLAFIVPQYEAVKAREKSGRAYLDFPVNKTTIYPDYRNNPRELDKIKETIRSVRDDKYATITDVSIKGYASPEGSYANNARLARERAKALLEHVKGMYHFNNVNFVVSSEPEDWAGLDSLVSNSSIKGKEAVLAIIRDPNISSPDTRDLHLKQLAGGEPYRFLLARFYPALRHSDYMVRYQIRNFTVEEAKQLIYTDPKQLSLEEMYRVAQTYEPGSRAFNEVFEISVRMYPDDPVSNLNAANIALQNKDAEAARHYLQKAQPGKEKDMAAKALLQLETYLKEMADRTQQDHLE